VPTIVYVQVDGIERRVEVPSGQSVMLGAIQNNVRGIDAECGGCLSCATCHVYVDAVWVDRLPVPDTAERELLEGVAAERRPTSRLSCQLTVGPALDGLVLHLPTTQS
jgi:2Fe-2S ferredoxin